MTICNDASAQSRHARTIKHVNLRATKASFYFFCGTLIQYDPSDRPARQPPLRNRIIRIMRCRRVPKKSGVECEQRAKLMVTLHVVLPLPTAHIQLLQLQDQGMVRFHRTRPQRSAEGKGREGRRVRERDRGEVC
jgi:hypothetical protein